MAIRRAMAVVVALVVAGVFAVSGVAAQQAPKPDNKKRSKQEQQEIETVVKLVDGPFSTLEGEWRFVGLDAGNSGPPASKVMLDLRYAFSSGALQSIVSPVFDRIANTLVDSFVKRAEQVHGPR